MEGGGVGSRSILVQSCLLVVVIAVGAVEVAVRVAVLSQRRQQKPQYWLLVAE